MDNSLTEIEMEIKVFVRLNTSQESGLTANRESQEECNQRKHNAGETEAQNTVFYFKTEKEFENLVRVSKTAWSPENVRFEKR